MEQITLACKTPVVPTQAKLKAASKIAGRCATVRCAGMTAGRYLNVDTTVMRGWSLCFMAGAEKAGVSHLGFSTGNQLISCVVLRVTSLLIFARAIDACDTNHPRT